MNIDVKQVIQDLEHIAIKHEREFKVKGTTLSYRQCIYDLKNHPEIVKVCAPQIMKPETAEELEARKPNKKKEEIEDRGGIRCKFCGVDGFKWKDRNADAKGDDIKESWHLVDKDTGEAHFCR